MIFATVLSLCLSASPQSCNDYIVDVAASNSDCMDNLITHSVNMSRVWNDDNKLAGFLKEFRIVEPISQLNDYDYTCSVVPEHEIP